MGARVISLSVKDCAGCGGDHDRVLFTEFEEPLYIGAVLYEWGAYCPDTGEIIISDWKPKPPARKEARPIGNKEVNKL